MTTDLAIGTRFTVTGHPVKADNGTFEICTVLPQPNGRETSYVWRRIVRGVQSESGKSRNCRGGRWATVAQFATMVPTTGGR